MSNRDEEFLGKLRATFRVEAAEHLQAMTAALLELEKAPARAAPRKIVETVFRAAHSLKGAARTVGFGGIESVCQSLEDVFAAWKEAQAAPSAGALDAIHRALDAIRAGLDAWDGSSAMGDVPDPAALRESLSRWVTVAPPRATPATKPMPVRRAPPPAMTPAAPTPTAQGPEETVRVSLATLEARLLQAEEMLIARLAADQRVTDMRDLTGRFQVWRHAWAALEPYARRLRLSFERAPVEGDRRASSALPQLLDFCEWSADYLKSVEDRTAKLSRTAEQERYLIGKLVDDLLENSKKLLLLPFATVAAPLPKLVRDLCRDQGKEADLTIRGEDIEIDRHILEEIKDPLVHLLRNGVDHGVEPAEVRARRGKPPRASLTLEATQVEGNKAQLRLSDDGAGIDIAKVKESAIRCGVISADEAEQLDEAAALELIFRSEVSTSPLVTRVSGRGLGLAIVRDKAEKLGGTVSVASRPGVGTTFNVIVPAVRATFRGILVEAAGRVLVVPTTQVARVARAVPEDVKTVEGRESVSVDGRTVALVRLADVLELPPVEAPDAPRGPPIIVLGAGDQSIAFAVDAVLDEQEVLVKPLRKPLSRVRNVAAATVLASGQVAPILNVADLLKSARKAAAVPRGTPAAAARQDRVRTILVAEDSITSRMLLKAILESAGYNVKTAVDGMEALTRLRTERFDLVVSDVEMPRLNGFDLTARIRADRKLADLPVVLVTALETREDRERGIDAGANAYLVKSRFDQSDLLEAVRRLIGGSAVRVPS